MDMDYQSVTMTQPTFPAKRRHMAALSGWLRAVTGTSAWAFGGRFPFFSSIASEKAAHLRTRLAAVHQLAAQKATSPKKLHA